MAPVLEVVTANVLKYPADVLVLKFAQDLYGVDAKVVSLLAQTGIDLSSRLPEMGKSLLIGSEQVVQATELLFCGVEPLGRFDYGTIREFAHRALAVLAQRRPHIEHLAMTLHGRGFGLDEAEAFRAEVAGVLDALAGAQIPAGLKRISIVERDPEAASRMRALLGTIAGGRIERLARHDGSHERGTGRDSPPESNSNAFGAAREELNSVGRRSLDKPLVFVAMPFADQYGDRFHYGIRGAVNAAGYLCERADLASFTGDVVAWVKERIDKAALVVADLTAANPNVYLEVGYAWGRDVRTVLIVAEGDELKFDVRTQRCLVFRNIRHLEELLTAELQSLRTNSDLSV